MSDKTIEALQVAQAEAQETVAETIARLTREAAAAKAALEASNSEVEQLRSAAGQRGAKNSDLTGKPLAEALELSGLKGYSVRMVGTLVDPAGKDVEKVFEQRVGIAMRGADRQNGNVPTHIGAHFQAHPVLRGRITIFQGDLKIEKVGKRG